MLYLTTLCSSRSRRLHFYSFGKHLLVAHGLHHWPLQSQESLLRRFIWKIKERCCVREQREDCSHQAGSGLEEQPISNPTVVLTPGAEPQPHGSRRQSERRVRAGPPDPAPASRAAGCTWCSEKLVSLNWGPNVTPKSCVFVPSGNPGALFESNRKKLCRKTRVLCMCMHVYVYVLDIHI